MKSFCRIIGLIASWSLSACAVQVLPNGEPSGMSADNNQLRVSLAPAAVPSPPILPYKPIKDCSYTSTSATQFLDKPQITEQLSISVKSVPGNPDKLLVVETKTGGKISTYLINRYSGKVLDFNAVDLISGQRYTPESSTVIAKQDLADIPSDRNPHFINGLSLVMPEFIDSGWNIDDIAAYVNDETGHLWAYYAYRGIVSYSGIQGQLFDLVRMMPSLASDGPILVGFLIFDPSTMMPVLSVLDAGTRAEVTRIACDG